MTDKEFQDKLNNWRTELRLMIAERSLREAAEEIGLSHMTIARVLNGQTPSLKVFWQINGWIQYEQREAAATKRAKDRTTKAAKKKRYWQLQQESVSHNCGHCTFEESNGALIKRCASCQIKHLNWWEKHKDELDKLQPFA